MICNRNRIIYICIVIGICGIQNTATVEITSLDVPQTAWNTVTLNCRYNLEDNEKLYAVKWYKDGEEFFRCLGNGTIQVYPSNDIQIFYTKSAQLGSCYFELTALTNKSGGNYMCEVSLDWPTFKVVRRDANLSVVNSENSAHKADETDNESEEVLDAGSSYLKPNLMISAIFICNIFKLFHFVFNF